MSEFFKKVRSIKGLAFLIVGIIAGLILIIFGSINGNKKADDIANTTDIVTAESKDTKYYDEYLSDLENKLTLLINNINGVSEVNVMIYLDGSYEYVYAQDHKSDDRNYVVINDSGKNETPILVKEVYPKIRGVAIVCGGGGNPLIQAQILNLVCALFKISSNNVYVTG
jgi:stage III sporulation protein AG